MSNIVQAALFVLPDEKAWNYIEMDEQSPGSHGFHRYKIILIKRGDSMAEYREDMGKSELFKDARRTIHIPAVFEHTVGELLDIADELRYERGRDELDVRELAGVYPFNKPWEKKIQIVVET